MASTSTSASPPPTLSLHGLRNALGHKWAGLEAAGRERLRHLQTKGHPSVFLSATALVQGDTLVRSRTEIAG